MAKASDGEVSERIALVFEMVIKGASRAYIVRYCSKNYNISSRQVDTYMQRVNEQIKELYGEDYKKRLIEKQLAQLDDLYVKNYTIEDYRECRNLIESKNKMLGLNAPDKTDITTNGKEIIPQSIPLVLSDGRTYEDLTNELKPE